MALCSWQAIPGCSGAPVRLESYGTLSVGGDTLRHESAGGAGGGHAGAEFGVPGPNSTLVKSSTDGPFQVSVVMPCLNEGSTVGACVQEAYAAIDRLRLRGEVVVVDNGSSDDSIQAALQAGARVVVEPVLGYGSACRRGLEEAQGELLVLVDSDGTYDLTTLRSFVEPLTNGTDLVIGSRLRGTIESGAMPWLHRYVGNPLLTSVLNLMLGSGISDAHCGLRAIKRDRYLELPLVSTGMEFASEFLLTAGRHGLRIEETPITYRRREGGEPKLRTFRDGWRHLKLMLALAIFPGSPQTAGRLSGRSGGTGEPLTERDTPLSGPVH